MSITTLAIISFALAGGAYSLLLLQLINSWRGQLPGGLLMTAAGLTAIWALTTAYMMGQGAASSGLIIVLDALRLGTWILFIAILAGFRGPAHSSTADSATWTALAATSITVVAGLVQIVTGSSPSIAGIGNIAYAGILVVSVTGLVLIEQLFRNSHADRRWAIKFLCIGLGGTFAYALFLYSQSLLQQQIAAGPEAVHGIILTLIVPLLGISVARNPDWSLNIFVSRRVVFHSAALMGSGIYLLFMAIGGYYLRFYGGNWGAAAQIIFLFGAAVLLLVILFSGRFQATLKVFLSKHFFSYKYDYRDEWLRLTQTLSGADGDLRERAVRALAQIVESPGGALWLRNDNDMLMLVSHWNLPDCEAPPEPLQSSLAHFCEHHRWVIDLGAYRSDPDQYPDLQLPDWLLNNPRGWLLIPLLHHERLQGFVLLTQPRVRHALNWEDFDLLKAAASQTAAHIAQAETQEALLEARQFEAYNRFSTFVVHDLKNLIAQLSLLVSNASRHRHNPEFMDDAVETIEHSVNRMQKILSQLRSGGLPDPNAVQPLDLRKLAQAVAARQAQKRPQPALDLCPTPLCIHADGNRLEGVVCHIVENAQQATSADGNVSVSVYREKEYGVIEVTDNGHGMDQAFIQQELFRPFSSTRENKGMGIGAFQARSMLRSLGGDIEVSSEIDHGSSFRLLFPCPQQATETTLTDPEQAPHG